MFKALASLAAGLRALIQGLVTRFFTEPVQFPSGRKVTPIKLLAEGGFSFVYSATELSTGRQFALKKMICQDSEAKTSARDEAEVHEKFSHRNLLPIEDKLFQRHPTNQSWEICWFVFPLCSCSLRDEITQQVLYEQIGKERVPGLWGLSKVVHLMSGVCCGLQEMHRQGVSHRDVKPENVLLQLEDGASPPGRPVLMDFGSCGRAEVHVRSRREALQETETAARLCTMQYRAPELFDVPSDSGVLSYALADVWSAGCTLYCCMLGYSPFEVEYDQQARPRQVETGHLRALAPIPWPREGPRETVPAWFKELVRGILAVNPKDRPPIGQVLQHLSNAPSGDCDRV